MNPQITGTTSPEDGDSDFLELVCRYLDDQLTAAELLGFNQRLRTNDACRQTFARYCFQGRLLGETLVKGIPLADDASQAGQPAVLPHVSAAASTTSPPLFSGVLHNAFGHLSTGWPLAYLVATVILGVGLVIGAVTHVSQPEQVVGRILPLPISPSPVTSVVGRITGVLDCRFAADSKTEDQRPKTGVSLGDKFNLVSGLLEITYDTGARVILQGPVTYTVESSAGGFLAVGKLTARVENPESQGLRPKTQDPNPKSPNHQTSKFVVRTPTAMVTDLGTEFGVEVARSGETTSHVFRGSIRVERTDAAGQVEGDGQVVHENQTARVEVTPGHRQIVFLRTLASSHFVREMSKRTIKVFDLVDVVAGGNGFTGRRNRGIDPTTGQIADDRPMRRNIRGDHKYHRVKSLPFVDGVFLPDGGNGPVQVDSAGHTFDGFHKTDNNTVGPVWAGPVVSVAPDPPEVIPTDMGGVDYASAGHGLLFMHANKGITFDLEVIRRTSPGSKLVRFRAMAGNQEDPSLHGEYVRADIWVLVDGRVRFQRREINSTQGVFQIAIPIGEHDRFLTLAATDGGNSTRADWIMFGDPRLELMVERE
jgi:hypothetical protein